MPARRLAIVVSTGPARRDLETAATLAHAARAAGVEVELFLMDRGVASAAASRDTLEGLIEQGCDIVACASSVEDHGGAALPAEVLLGSQDDHAAIVGRANRVVAFT